MSLLLCPIFKSIDGVWRRCQTQSLRRAVQWLWLLCFVTLIGLPAGALQSAEASKQAAARIGNQDRYDLSREFDFFLDASASLKLDDVLKPEVNAKFQALPRGEGASNFGSTNAAIWLRLTLQADTRTPLRWLMDIAYPPLDRIDLYTSNPSGGFDHQTGGDSLPFSDRVIVHHSHVKPIDLAPGQPTTLYLRIATEGTLVVPVILWQPAALWKSDQITYSIFSLYFGLLIGLIAYNLLLFFSMKDRLFLIYVAFAGVVGLSQAANSGLGAQFLWPNQTWWNSNSINVLHAAGGGLGLTFTRSFLTTRLTLPRLDRLMRVQIVLWVIAVLLSLTIPYRMASWSVTALVAAGVLTIVVTTVTSLRYSHPGAKYFALAWGALLAGVVTLTLHNTGLLPSNVVTSNALLIGSALEMVLLSLALADRINLTRREKELAQAQVTSEQAMVLALHQSQERYRSVIEHVAEGMVVLQDEKVVFVNLRASEILQDSKAAISCNGLYVRLHPDDQALVVQRHSDRHLRQDVSGRCHVRLMCGKDSIKWLELGDTVVPWDGGPALLVFFLDVTERHAAEQETRAALLRQRELNDLRSRFVAMTSHEFRTPLATILSAQDILKNYNERLPDDQKKELFEMIEAGVQRMTRMIERVLLVGKVEAQMLDFIPRKTDLKRLCAELVSEARVQQPDGSLMVTLAFAEEVRAEMFDEQLLRQILGNLLSNAVKYSPHGGEVRLSVYPQGSQTVFEIADQGIGIPADEIDHLFESFHRASNVGSIQGTGLGLAIVRQSALVHGGTVEVVSTLGVGTCFTVRL